MSLAWSCYAMDMAGQVVEDADGDRPASTASVGKVFLLCEVADGIADGRLDPLTVLPRDSELAVSDSGLWQHFVQDSLLLVDACLLIGAVSDNWATNVVLDVVGLPAVADRASALGCADSGLHDRVRDARTEADPATLSTGTTRELAEVARRIHVAASGTLVPGISMGGAELVERWLLAGVDLSMVPAPLHLDPLAHVDGPIRVWSKTGTDAGVRADMGVIWSDGGAVAYAAVANWDPAEDRVAQAMARMHDLGAELSGRVW